MGMTPSKQSDDDVMLDVNMTPLIDVMLVLIIMFIITIPIQNDAININMPNPSNQPNDEPPQLVTVKVQPDGTITWNGEVVHGKDALEQKFRLVANKPKQDQVQIRPELTTPYKDVAMVMAAAQRNGVTNMGVISGNP